MPQDNILEFTKQNNHIRTHDGFLSVTDMDRKKYTNQIRRFPVVFRRNNKHIMIVYDYNSNIINAEYLKSRSGYILKTAYEKIHK